MARENSAANAIMFIVGIPLGLIFMTWTLLITWTAFVGGQAPFFFIDFDGTSILRGLFWLIIVDPIIITIAGWGFFAVMALVTAPFIRLNKE